MNDEEAEFFRFPRTPHIAWLAEASPRDDKLLSPAEAEALLDGEVVIEEKIDGANLGISLGPDGDLRLQNRGQFLMPPYGGQFARLGSWLAPKENAVFDALDENQILFGEWCAARHSVAYDRLPDWFLLFDVYDRSEDKFWSASRRDTLAGEIGLSIVPRLFQGRTTVPELKELVGSAVSQFREGTVEGVVLRSETPQWLVSKAKLVRSDFVQNIEEHWRGRAIEWNRLETGSS